jgi:hypothetical protein
MARPEGQGNEARAHEKHDPRDILEVAVRVDLWVHFSSAKRRSAATTLLLIVVGRVAQDVEHEECRAMMPADGRVTQGPHRSTGPHGSRPLR